ncbi:putative late blight resistance protein -like protein R1B-11 [Capsicum chinense]|nr:putative late blight resistance protein -like protein R1B-11 [Capsicum chinense]
MMNEDIVGSEGVIEKLPDRVIKEIKERDVIVIVGKTTLAYRLYCDRGKKNVEQVANNLGPHIHRYARVIIEHSYQKLPYHLRSCFLYFGAFLEDHVINVSELTRLKISEGFLKSWEGKSLEDIAVAYLDNLIRRNLVTVARSSLGGKVNACCIHDLLYDFCKEKAKEENLLLLIRWDQNDSSSDTYSQGQPAHRLSISNKNGHCTRELRSSWSLVGSISLRNEGLSNFQVYNIVHSFKFLKILDLNRAYHGLCMRHLAKNLSVNQHCGEHIYLFYATTNAYIVDEFSENFVELKNNCPEAAHVLENVLDFENWSRSHFLGNRYDVMTTNFTELLNSMLLDEKQQIARH